MKQDPTPSSAYITTHSQEHTQTHDSTLDLVLSSQMDKPGAAYHSSSPLSVKCKKMKAALQNLALLSVFNHSQTRQQTMMSPPKTNFFDVFHHRWLAHKDTGTQKEERSFVMRIKFVIFLTESPFITTIPIV